LKGQKENKKRRKKMKLTKFRIAVLVLFVATVIYAVAFASSAWHHYSEGGEILDDPVLGKVFGDPERFLNTSEGFTFFMAGVGTAIMWIAIIARHSNPQKRERKKLLVLILLFPLTFTIFIVKPLKLIIALN